MKKSVGGLALVAAVVLAFALLYLTRPPQAVERSSSSSLPVDASAPPASVVVALPPEIVEPAPIELETAPSPLLSAREHPAPPPPAGILRAGGAVLAGATLGWTPLFAELEGIEFLNDVDFARVRAGTVTTTSDAAGRFEFPAVADGAEQGESVVWITCPGREAVALALARADETGWSWPDADSVPERAPVRVTVKRADAPVAGARVRQVLSFWNPENPAANRLRRVFLRESETGADGTTTIVPGAGENALLATLGEESSLLWVGEPTRAAGSTSEIALELRPTLEVSGQLALDPPGELAPLVKKARWSVGYFGAPDRSDLVYARGSRGIRLDGGFGPERWPWVASERLLVHVGNGRITPVEKDLPNPGAGARVFVDLRTTVGTGLTLRVATHDGAPLAGATAIAAHWTGREWIGIGQAASGADGTAELAGIPAGQASVTVTKAGFTTVAVSDERVLIPRRADGPLEIQLAPAGVVTGFVVRADEPVKDFQVEAWNSSGSYRFERVLHDEEGAFRIEDAPRGEALHVLACNARLPESEIASVVPADAPVEVVLELPVPRHARGKVIDALTRAPLAGAEIQHLTSGAGGLGAYRGARMHVQADGSFELDGFFPGRGGFAVFADGYESLFYGTREDDTEVIDVGLLALSPLSVLDVVVRAEGVADHSTYRVWNALNEDWEPLALASDGRLALAARSGAFEVHLLEPDGHVSVQRGLVSPGEHATVLFEAASGVTLTVAVRAVSGSEPPRGVEGWKLVAFTRAGALDRSVSARWSSELGAFRLRGLAPGDAELELRDGSDVLLVQRSLRLDAEAFQTTTLELGGERRRLRLVDGRGKPWDSITVSVTLDDASGWSTRLDTDANGELVLGPLSEVHVVLSALLASESLAYGVPVALEPDPARTTLVTLEPGARVLLRLLEEGRPRAGAHVVFQHERAPRWLEFGYISDENGLVRGPFCARGTYSVRVNNAGDWPVRHAVRAADSPEPLAFELFGRATLDFRVTDSSGAPLAGATLELEQRELDESAADWIRAGLLPSSTALVTDLGGELVLEGIPRGTYAWTATAPSGERATGTLHVAPGERATVPLRIDVR